MPLQARALKEYFGGGSETMMSRKEDQAPPSLGHSEELPIQYPPDAPPLGARGNARGEKTPSLRYGWAPSGKCSEDDRKITGVPSVEHCWDLLPEDR